MIDIVDVGGPPLSPGNQYFETQSATVFISRVSFSKCFYFYIE